LYMVYLKDFIEHRACATGTVCVLSRRVP